MSDNSSAALRSQFLLDPSVVFLNHGSFGACPAPVFDTYHHWQRELERQPVEFLGRRHDTLMNEAREQLAAYLNADMDNLVFVPNSTAGINMVARSLTFEPGDEILATSHEYGALNLAWRQMCGSSRARYVEHPVALPVATAEAFVESFWSAVTPRTRVVYLSHVTSPTALVFPIAEIIRRAREAGIISIVDGAHAPGHIPVDLTALDPDFYAGNCHKWLCAPKGSAFLYARPEHHRTIKPLVISWGWSDEATFVSRAQQQGTRDIAAFLSVPAAIDFQAQHRWQEVRQRCHVLTRETRNRIAVLTELPHIAPDSADWFMQMATMPLPPCDPVEVKRRLYDAFRIEIPIFVLNEQPYIRVSFQGYNTPEDADALVNALAALFN